MEAAENSRTSTEAAIGLSVECLNVRNTIPHTRSGAPTKKPHTSSDGAQKTAPLLAKDAIPAAREGGLAYGLSADYSGGTAADLHGLPRFPCLQKMKLQCMSGLR